MTSEQKEAFLNSWFDADDGYHWSHGMANQIEHEVSDRFDEAMRAYTRAVPDVPELVRYVLGTPAFHDVSCMMERENGEYVRYDQAAEIIAAKDAEIERLKEQNDKFKWQVRDTCTRAEAAEAKLARYEAQHEKEMTEVIKERDQCEAWADKLAYAIGGEAIGEHSNMNSPWANALEIAASPAPAADLKAENEEISGQDMRIIKAFDPDNDLDNPEKFNAYHDLEAALKENRNV